MTEIEAYDRLVERSERNMLRPEIRCKQMLSRLSPFLADKTRQALAEFTALLPKELTDMEKVSILYQCVAAEGSYAPGVIQSRHRSFLGALRDREAVCAGYAELMLLLVNAATNCRIYTVTGYTCRDIRSLTPGSSTHAWNLVVFPDGSTYHMDVTWDLGYLTGGRKLKWLFLSDQKVGRYWLKSHYPAAPQEFAGKYYQNDELLDQLRAYYRSLALRFEQGTYTLPRYIPERRAKAS